MQTDTRVFGGPPARQGLYDPALRARRLRRLLRRRHEGPRAATTSSSTGLGALCNLEHRGATGRRGQHRRRRRHPHPDPRPLPAGRRRLRAARRPAPTPPASPSCPPTRGGRPRPPPAIEEIVGRARASRVLGWRDVPIDDSMLGADGPRRDARRSARCSSPAPAGAGGHRARAQLFCVRKRIEHEVAGSDGERRVYFPTPVVPHPRLQGHAHHAAARRVLPRPRRRAGRVGAGPGAQPLLHQHVPVVAAGPPVPLRRPQRRDQHGAGQPQLDAGPRGAAAPATCSPATSSASSRSARPAASDSASFDEVLELLHLGGRSLPHAVLMMIPEAWENHESMDPAKRAFYRFHASLMEPWDGPASIAFTDGTVIGAVLDRNGLRPSRYWVTDDDLVIMASEVGVLDVDPAEGRAARAGSSRAHVPGRHGPGPHRRRRRDQGDAGRRAALRASGSTPAWSQLDDLPEREHVTYSHESVLRRQQVFGYTHEELKILLAPMARTGAEPIGSMGTDTPDRRAVGPAAPAVRLLPAAVRPGHQPAARRHPRGAGHRARRPRSGPRATCSTPARRRAARSCCRSRSSTTTSWPSSSTSTTTATCPASRPSPSAACTGSPGAAPALRRALDAIRRQVSEAIADGRPHHRALRPRRRRGAGARSRRCCSPSAVHHHLIREKTRTQVGLVVECGDAREVHHMALLLGYGAGAINPYLAFETIEDLIAEGLHGIGGHRPEQGRAATTSRRPARAC